MLYDGFLRSLDRNPEALALDIGERAWTYTELDALARSLAARILREVERPERIGVFAYRSEAAYVAPLAALFAGACFVPLNPGFPLERTRAMIALSDVDAVVVDPALASQLRGVLAGLDQPPLVIEATSGTIPSGISAPLRAAGPEDPAYLLFTSGSSGVPKGVAITHANVDAFLAYGQERYRISPSDRLTQNFDQTFDLSVFDIFMAWQGGACVCVPRPIELLAPFRFVERKRITVWFSVPSVAALLMKKNLLEPGSLPSLRLSLFCGEALPRAVAEAWQEAAPESVVENLYGPTELTIACSVYRWSRERSPGECVNGVVPIGSLFPGMSGVLASGATLVPGAEGELCVAGPQAFAGYFRDPARSAEAFLELREPDGEVRRYYRTGDRVRVTEAGHLAYLGRSDTQIKVNGYRVELGEIEAALRSVPGVVQAVAMPCPGDGASASGIMAFVSGVRTPASDTERVLKERLPAYMIPKAVRWTENMPLNVNGKIDRIALARSAV